MLIRMSITEELVKIGDVFKLLTGSMAINVYGYRDEYYADFIEGSY